MDTFIAWCQQNPFLQLSLSSLCGYIGYLIFKKSDPEFYEGRTDGWWFMTAFFCIMLIGPGYLICSLVRLCAVKLIKEKKKPMSRFQKEEIKINLSKYLNKNYEL